MNEINKKERLW